MEADYLENTVVIDESNLTAEQQLGLKQAEERLERDYISRLEKVGWVIYQIKKEDEYLLLPLFLHYSESLWSFKILTIVIDWLIVTEDRNWKLSLPYVTCVAFIEQYFLFFNYACLKVYISITYVKFSRKSYTWKFKA